MASSNTHRQPSLARQQELVDVDEQPQMYFSGNPPPTSDDQLLQRFDIDDSDVLQGRPSMSYDDFVGSAPAPNRTTYGRDGPSALEQLNTPSFTRTRALSQSPERNVYQRYSDGDGLPDDTGSVQGYYADEEAVGQNMAARTGKASYRNSILSLGGGLMGRTKNMFGMGPKYSEMDVPLTDGRDGVLNGDGQRPEAQSGPRGADKLNGKHFKFGFGKRRHELGTIGPRVIYLNNPSANSSNKYMDNHISTAKYNFATFLPKFLYEQFSKYANLFFLFTAAIQQIPGISPTNPYTTIVPLLIVLMVSAIKEIIEDLRRKRSDKGLNHSRARVLKGSAFQDTRWVNIAVGDIVRVESEEPIPADLVLLATSEPEGLCYIETANLDGETNLKIKQAIPETADLVSYAELSRLGGRISSEQPNSSLYTYEGSLTMQTGGGEKELPLNPDQLLLRGATLRNTPWVHGVVVFTGHETKLMRNATATPIKRTAVERMVNLQVLILCGVLVVLSLISSVGDLIVRSTAAARLTYLYYGKATAAKQFFSDILTYWVLYSNLVPISLFVTIEIVKYCQAFLIDADLDIYYEKTDTPANCRTSSLVEELGQVEYIFSDKTGTLTCNQMEFRQCSIKGIQYADEVPEDRRAAMQDGIEVGIQTFDRLRENRKTRDDGAFLHHFLELLAICHTVIPEKDDQNPGNIKYQAASPDEGALVEGAVPLGYQFVNRKPRFVGIRIDGVECEYELLAVCEFNSTRKRMSTIFKCPDGKIRCYCKGADTVILERLAKDDPNVEITLRHLEEYATEGLRTLCLAMKEVPDDEFREWIQVHNKAATTVSGSRAEELDKAAEIIEHGFTLLGATAIEDKLQDGVPETIHTLQVAGIKVWVLTGDRQETAINIGMSCKLISEDMTLLIINEDNHEATRDNISRKLAAIRTTSDIATEMDNLALVIDGKSLTYALERDMEKSFLDLAVMCKAVICW
jgi:phospholipid-transporting ATPase